MFLGKFIGFTLRWLDSWKLPLSFFLINAAIKMENIKSCTRLLNFNHIHWRIPCKLKNKAETIMQARRSLQTNNWINLIGTSIQIKGCWNIRNWDHRSSNIHTLVWLIWILNSNSDTCVELTRNSLDDYNIDNSCHAKMQSCCFCDGTLSSRWNAAHYNEAWPDNDLHENISRGSLIGTAIFILSDTA